MDGSASVFLAQDSWAGMIFSGGWGRAAGGVYDVTAPADGSFVGSLSGGCIENAVVAEACEALADGRGRIVRFGAGSPYLDIRLPCGGTSGSGPFHSQSMEAIYAHYPGLVVVTPATVADAYHMLIDSVRLDDPGYRMRSGQLDFAAHYLLIDDNLLDLSRLESPVGEIQRTPQLFQSLRGLIDVGRRRGRGRLMLRRLALPAGAVAARRSSAVAWRWMRLMPSR